MILGVSHPIYDDPEEYDRQFSGGDDLLFYLFEAARAGGPVLEIGVGTGRVGIPLAEFGISVTGIDRSEKMLSRARAKAVEADVKIRLIEGDSLTLSIPERFSLVCIPGNPVSEYRNLRDWELLLGRVREHLRPGGRLAFNIANPGSHPGVMDYPPLPASSRTRANRFKDLPEEDRKEFRFGYLYPEETRFILERGGFEVESFLGDYGRKSFSIKDPRQVVVARPFSKC